MPPAGVGATSAGAMPRSPCRGCRAPRGRGVAVEGLSIPGQHLFVFIVERIEGRLEKPHEAGDASGIFGRAPPLAGDEGRVVDVRLLVPDLFDDGVVAPVVAGVMDVEKPLDAPIDEASQADPRRIADFAFKQPVVGKGLAVDAIVNHELEQMRIGPADGDLDDVVQGQQGGGERDVEAPPECRFDLLELDSDTCDWLDQEGAAWSLIRTCVNRFPG